MTSAARVWSLTDIEALARRALDEYGLSRQGWVFAWDRAVRRAGLCSFTRHVISLSRPIFTIESNRHDALETILHEVAHALAGPRSGHGPKWRAIAARIGARPEACHWLVAPALAIVGTCACDVLHQRVRMPAAGVRHRCHLCRTEITWRRRRFGIPLGGISL